MNPRAALDRLRDAVSADAAHGRVLAKDLFHRNSSTRVSLVQVLKAAGASVLAWWLSAAVLHLPLPYVAPMAAMIMVRSTVYWSMLTGARQVVAVGFGAVVADLALGWVGSPTLALALALPPTLLIGRYHRLDDQGIYAPFSALFLIAFGGSEGHYVGYRLLETALGAAVGTGVNLLILPPTYLEKSWSATRRATSAADRLLRDISRGLRDGPDCERTKHWVEEAERLDREVADLREALRQGSESLRLNPRAPSRRHRNRLDERSRAAARLARVTSCVESLVGILRDAACDGLPEVPFGAGFTERYADVVNQSADALTDAIAGRRGGAAEELSRLLTELERELDASPISGAAEAELRGSLVLTARRLHHDITTV